MGAKKVPSKCHASRKLGLCMAIAALSAMAHGLARAELHSASVGALLATDGMIGQWATQPNGPYIASLSGIGRSAGVWTDYGINRAGATISASYGTYPGGYVIAASRWEDQLTIHTSNAAPDAWVRLLFSVRLDGHLEAHEDDFYYSGARVGFAMTLNHEGSWISRPDYNLAIGPTPWTTDGGHVAVDVDELLFGEIEIQNGHTFNLISELSVNPAATLSGPSGIGWAESLFGNSAEWLGGSVWINGAPASAFTITSASGYDYGQRSSNGVPEPASLTLLGIGLAVLAVLGFRSRNLA